MQRRNKLVLIALLTASAATWALADPVKVAISGTTRIRGTYFNRDRRGDTRFIQQNTRISINVDLTSNVSAVVDLDHTADTRDDRRPASRLRRISRSKN